MSTGTLQYLEIPSSNPNAIVAGTGQLSFRQRSALVGSLKSLSTSFANSFNMAGYSYSVSCQIYFFYSNLDPNSSYNNMRLVSPICQNSIGADFAHVAGLEENFCKDFLCCGMNIGNLHDLLQHFEEHHVHIEDDLDDDDEFLEDLEDNEILPFELDDNMEDTDDMDMETSDLNSSVFFQQSLYNDVYTSRTQVDTCPFDNSIITTRRPKSFALKNVYRMDDPAPQTIPYRFDPPTHINDTIQSNLQFMSSDSSPSVIDDSTDTEDSKTSPKNGNRPFKCSYPGCDKAYKNPGGLKYHSVHSHSQDSGCAEINQMIEKPYQCTVEHCGKRYKNLNGLKYHIEHAHLSLFGQ